MSGPGMSENLKAPGMGIEISLGIGFESPSTFRRDSSYGALHQTVSISYASDIRPLSTLSASTIGF